MTAEMDTGDFLLLLESVDFHYGGKVVHRVSRPCWDLSMHIWGEQRLPIIIFLRGKLILYSWEQFREDFNFAPTYLGWKMQGRTMKIGQQKIPSARWTTEKAFIDHCNSFGIEAMRP